MAHPLRHLVDSLPTPIALLMEEYLQESVPFITLHRLSDAAELITRFCTIVVLSDVYRQLGDFPELLRGELAEKLERPTFGNWQDITEAAVRSWKNIRKNQRQPWFMPELLEFWHKHWQPLISNKIIPLRNKLAHVGRLPDATAVEWLDEHRSQFEEALQRLDFLDKYRLLATQNEAEAALLLRGLPNWDDWSLQQLSSGEYPDNLQPQRVYLLKDSESLNLFPLHHYDAVMLWSEEEQAFREVDKPAPMLYFRYNKQRQRLEFTALSAQKPFDQRNEDFRQAFFSVFNLSEWRHQRQAQDERQSELQQWKYDFSDILPELAEGLVGRSEQLENVKQWVKSHQQTGGILWINGKPGVGKSAFMAAFTIRQRGNAKLCVVPFFFRSGDARCSPERFFQAAILQLSNRFGLSIQIDPSEPPLVQFRKVLEAVRHKQSEESQATPVVFLLDGLDEVASQHPDFVRLPLSYQNPCIIWVCVGRDELPLSEVFAVEGVERIWQDGELPPLTEGDVRELIEQECDRLKYELFERDEQTETGDYRNRFIEELVKRSEGLPLYVRLVIEDVQTGRLSFQDENKLPPSLRDYFEEILGRLKVGDIPQMLTDVLALLSWAAEPLTEEIFREVLRSQYAYTEDWEQVLTDALRCGHVMLRQASTPERGRGWKLYHDSVRQHLHNTPTIRTVRQRAQHLLLAWCSRWEEHKNPYTLRQYAGHLLEAKRYEELYVLTQNQAFRQAQADTLTDEPNVPLQTIQTALEAAMVQDDATKMAEFCLSHAWELISITQESPLDALRGGNIERAWRLADLYEIERCTLWYLLLAWELKDRGRLEEARRTLDRLQERGVPRLSDWQGQLAGYLLIHLLDISETAFNALQRHLLPDDNVIYRDHMCERRFLCERLAEQGRFAAAIETAQLLEFKGEKAEAMAKIAAIQTLAGEKTAAQTNFAIALETARKLGEDWSALLVVAIVQAQAGEREAARTTLTSVLEAIQKLDRKHDQQYSMRAVAVAQAQMGDYLAALETARQIDEDWPQSQALDDIAAKQAQAGNFVAALETAKQITSKPHQAIALGQIAKAQAKAGEKKAAEANFAIALETVQQIVSQDSEWESLLGSIAVAQAQAGEFTSALETAQQIESKHRWARVLEEVAEAQAQAGEWEAAKSTFITVLEATQKNDNRLPQAEALGAIAKVQALTGKLEASKATFTIALDIAQQIKDIELRVQALRSIAEAQAQAGEKDAARLTFIKALEAVPEINNRFKRVDELEQIALSQTKLGDFATALETAHQIIDQEWIQSRLIGMIATAQAQAGEFVAALETVKQIQDESHWGETIGEIVKAQFRAGNCELAEATISTALETVPQIQEPWEQEMALAEIAKAQAQLGDLVAALKTIQPIQKSWRKESALAEIAKAQAKFGDSVAALKTIQPLQEQWIKERALEEIATAQAELGNLAIALETVQLIGDTKLRANALSAIAKTVAQTGQLHSAQDIFSNALEIVQIIESEREQSDALGVIAKAQTESGEFPAALKTAGEMHNHRGQAMVLAELAKAQVREGFSQQALKTGEVMSSGRNWYLPEIAAAFVEIGDKANFKQLLTSCAYYLDAAYKMCGYLAHLYPEQAAQVAKVVSQFC